MSQASATTSLFGDGPHRFEGEGLLADVEAWRRGEAENFGWIILGDEREPKSASRFAARCAVFSAATCNSATDWSVAVGVSPILVAPALPMAVV